MENQLAYIDQGSFLALRALGHEPVQQLVWVYDHDINVDRLRELHSRLGHGLLGRRIERSPLPFGRHRWVAAPQQADMELCTPRPKSDLMLWTDEQAMIRVDPEYGPAWRMAVVPFTDGGGAVTLVVSHSVADIGATLFSIVGAAVGLKPDLGYPPPRSRSKRKALLEDFRATFRALPEMRRALKAAILLMREERPSTARATKRAKSRDITTAIRPSVYAVVPADEWDARAAALGGNSNILVAGFAARLGFLMGRTRPDGSVAIQFPMSDRTETDTRANALTGMMVSANPNEVIHSLAKLRADFKTELKATGESQHKLLASLALAPLTPKSLVRKLEGAALGEGPAVGCSNLGEVPELLTQLDGTPAEFILARGVEWPAGPNELDRVGDWLLIGSGRVGGKVLIFVTAWRAGAANTRDELTRAVEGCLSDFGLSGTFV